MNIITGTGFVPRLVALTNRMADAVIAGTYASAREAAKNNIVEYAGHETQSAIQRNIELGNFAKRIVKELSERGYDKFGSAVIIE